jgi:hypothetical protein
MIKPWHLVPFLAAAALAGAATWWDTSKEEWTPPPARLPEIPPIKAIPLPAPINATAARERPVLWSSRRVRKVVTKDASQLEDLGQSRLLSVVQSGSTLIALLRRKDGSLLKLTQDSAPWRVESCDGLIARFVSTDGQNVSLQLQAARPTDPKK